MYNPVIATKIHVDGHLVSYLVPRRPRDSRDLKHHDGRHDDGIPEVYFHSGHAQNLKS